MKIPSEAELIEMERQAYSIYFGRDHLQQMISDLLQLIRQLSPPAPIPQMARKKRRRLKAKKSYLKVINMKTLGAAGGKARAAKLSARQRKAAARNAANARWDAERERKAGVA